MIMPGIMACLQGDATAAGGVTIPMKISRPMKGGDTDSSRVSR